MEEMEREINREDFDFRGIKIISEVYQNDYYENLLKNDRGCIKSDFDNH